MTEERLKAILEEKSTKIFSDSDTMKKMGATSARGATKKVLVFQNRGLSLNATGIRVAERPTVRRNLRTTKAR